MMTLDEAEEILEKELEYTNIFRVRSKEENERLKEAQKVIQKETEKMMEDLSEEIKKQIRRKL